jgi:putative transposase
MDELSEKVAAHSPSWVQLNAHAHPFVERLIGTIRRECLDRLLFWTATDLEMKLIAFRDYYNGYRGHGGLKGETPVATLESKGANLKSYRWRQHCRGLYQTPMAA